MEDFAIDHEVVDGRYRLRIARLRLGPVPIEVGELGDRIAGARPNLPRPLLGPASFCRLRIREPILAQGDFATAIGFLNTNDSRNGQTFSSLLVETVELT
jgi:hypothetical protein